jgi:hypothetical protein
MISIANSPPAAGRKRFSRPPILCGIYFSDQLFELGASILRESCRRSGTNIKKPGSDAGAAQRKQREEVLPTEEVELTLIQHKVQLPKPMP